jgi:hypothetical protein
MGAPLTTQPIEIEALEVGNDRQNGSIERREAPGVSATVRFAACRELARA